MGSAIWTGEERPRLRAVEAIPVETQGRRVVCLRDPQGMAPEMFPLPLPAFFVACRLDGVRSLQEIQSSFYTEFGQRISLEELGGLVVRLDEKFFLESDGFQRHARKMESEFAAAPCRLAAHSGTAYETGSSACRRQIDGYFSHADGLGGSQVLAGMEDLRALVAPHIDYQRGGAVYSWAYGALRDAEPHDLYVVLGTSHVPIPYPFCLCLKDFDTPFGPAPVDRLFGQRLLKDLPCNFQEGQWAHRNEHSIEFQIVFLKYLFPEPEAFRILPILCGPVPASGPSIEERRSRMFLDEFLETLAIHCRETRRRICLIAGADLAHMGPRFGDSQPVDREQLCRLETADRDLLRTAENMDAQGFSAIITAEEDRRRICGYAPIYALLRTCGAREGKLLRYGQSAEADGSQVVTYAAMAFYGSAGIPNLSEKEIV